MSITPVVTQVGAWKDFNHKMKWTEGNVWTLSLKIDEPIFEFKYVVVTMATGEQLWEPGPNRLCVLSECERPIHLGINMCLSYRERMECLCG